MAFTAHNIRLPDGSFTLPERPLLAESPRMKATARVLRLVYKDAVHDKSIVDLGCLEGGYTVEFARMGMRSTGIEVRQSNYANCMLVKNKVQLPNLEFHNDDVLNLSRYGNFSVAFCSGLLYHLDRPAEFIRLMANQVADVIILNTSFATDQENPTFKLSPMTENEGLPGRWYKEHDTDDLTVQENAKWSSWNNIRSFWLTKSAILQVLTDCGFDMVFEQYDFLGSDIRSEMESGFYAKRHRSMFVGVRTGTR